MHCIARIESFLVLISVFSSNLLMLTAKRCEKTRKMSGMIRQNNEMLSHNVYSFNYFLPLEMTMAHCLSVNLTFTCCYDTKSYCFNCLLFFLSELDVLRKNYCFKWALQSAPCLGHHRGLEHGWLNSKIEHFSLLVICCNSCNFLWTAVLRLWDIGCNQVVCLVYHNENPL